jgi:hypothetical protein
MPVEQRITAIIRSAELSFELGIVNATRYGPLIHANVPDYAEILLKVFIDENRINPGQSDFPGLIVAVNGFFAANQLADQPKFQQIGDYFIDTRRAFRNPLHHTDRVQGYVIERSEALRCLLRFNELLLVLFPNIPGATLEDLNYPCYIQYLKMEHDQSLGRGNHRLYQVVISALQRLENENDYRCPADHDSSRLIAVRRLFRFDYETFTRFVLNYRPQIKGFIADAIHHSPNPLSSNQLLPRIKQAPNCHDLTLDEVERCLVFMEGEVFENYGIMTGFRTRTPTGNPIIRYSFVV